jgi:2-C-methyl-D-erythritol 4-phosphate cytidylyltransferase
MDLILLAAGVGKRTNLMYPKQFMRLGGIPILVRSLQLFMDIPEISNIIITVIPGTISEIENLISQYFKDTSKIIVIDGGSTRQESVYLALQHVNSNRVIIHEAARPFITKKSVIDLMAVNGDAIVPCVPIVPTVASKDKYFLNRDKLVNIQLPQVFNTKILKEAHEKGKGKNYSDDSSLVFEMCDVFPVLINGLEENIKITTKFDILLSEVLYEEFSNSGGWV